MLKKCTELINELKFEIVHYFDSLVERTLYLCNQILNDRYLQKKYVQKNKEQLTEYGKLVRKYYGRLVSLVDDIDSIRRTRLEQQKQTSSKKKYAEAI
jgi:GTP1/Obg family GTP-binding protein